jgi:hypothetical protein
VWAVALPERASAFCRTTTCDPASEDCDRDRNGCITTGLPLFWPDLCVTFGVQQDGSARSNISFADANRIATEAFRAWVSADCGKGEHPSLGVVPLGEVVCDRVEFNNDPPLPNANIIMFRDDDWPYSGSSTTIALTTLTFDVATGEILDADIEVNSADMDLSIGDNDVTSDLQSILTHETGHFLGLAHSREPTATMNANYDRADIGFRSLSGDDERGICSVYPAGLDLNECRGAQPRYGFSRYCATPYEDSGCGIGISRTPSRFIAVAAVASLLVFTSRRRRRSQAS